MLITEEYKELNRKLHQDNEHYGTSGSKWRDIVRNISDWGRLAILDYGAGKCTLAKSLGPAYRVTNYDPCIEGLDTPPQPHDVVVCSDVMEHIEPECVDAVIKEISKLTKKRAFFCIALVPASKTLADGRNAHLSLHPQDWWAAKLKEHGFTINQQSDPDNSTYNVWFIVY